MYLYNIYMYKNEKKHKNKSMFINKHIEKNMKTKKNIFI